MKFCSNCGAAYEEGVNFCSHCGVALAQGSDKQDEGEETMKAQLPVHEYQEYNPSATSNYPQPISSGLKILLIVLTIFVFPVGIIAGIVYLNDDLQENKKFGKGLLIFSIIWTLLTAFMALLPLLFFVM